MDMDPLDRIQPVPSLRLAPRCLTGPRRPIRTIIRLSVRQMEVFTEDSALVANLVPYRVPNHPQKPDLP